MAIEIKELSINVKVNADNKPTGHERLESSDEGERMERVIEECVQRVLNELSHKKEGR